MKRESIREKVSQALVEEFELEPAKMTPEARLKEDLGLDSLDLVDMVIVLEDACGCKIKDKSALSKIATLGDVEDFIAGLAEAGPGEREVATG
jgi:acyl carrier protein